MSNFAGCFIVTLEPVCYGKTHVADLTVRYGAGRFVFSSKATIHRFKEVKMKKQINKIVWKKNIQWYAPSNDDDIIIDLGRRRSRLSEIKRRYFALKSFTRARETLRVYGILLLRGEIFS